MHLGKDRRDVCALQATKNTDHAWFRVGRAQTTSFRPDTVLSNHRSNGPSVSVEGLHAFRSPLIQKPKARGLLTRGLTLPAELRIGPLS